MNKKNKKRGFTLAELLIVVAIIAILAVMAVPMYTNNMEKCREESDIANMKAAQSTALAAYMNDGAVGTKKYWFDATIGQAVDKKTDIRKPYGLSKKDGVQLPADYMPPYTNGEFSGKCEDQVFWVKIEDNTEDPIADDYVITWGWVDYDTPDPDEETTPPDEDKDGGK